MIIYVRNISYDTTPADVENLFKRYGTIKRVSVPKDYKSGKPRGFAFVEMNDPAQAELAVILANGSEFMGRTIYCCESTGKRKE